MGDANPIRTLGDYSKPSHEGYRNTIELPDPNQHLKDFLKLVDSLDLDGENRCPEYIRPSPHQARGSSTLDRTRLAPTQPTQVNKITTSCEICSGTHDTQYCIEDPEQAFVEYLSSRNHEAGEGLVSNFMASQDARLSKFEDDFKQQHSEMTNKIDTVLKAITDRLAGSLPSDTVKNPKEKIKLHQEKEMKFDRWRNKNFKNERTALVKIEYEVDDKREVTKILIKNEEEFSDAGDWTDNTHEVASSE
ncbi:hypothetical protein Tco_1132392 [Tanacetum coccineum]|uniref:MAK10-like protein n=1 Tax=Tanacetum coccineum TaxID=301880 RepID=A0ABQ5JCW1_9ASTR